jgi:hypothetical protein
VLLDTPRGAFSVAASTTRRSASISSFGDDLDERYNHDDAHNHEKRLAQVDGGLRGRSARARFLETDPD